VTLDLTPSADAALVASSLTELLAKEGGLDLRRTAEVSVTGTSTALWRTVTRLGYGALTLPARVGGADVDVETAAQVHRAFGRFLAPLPLLPCGLLVPALFTDASPDLAAAVGGGRTLATVDTADLAAGPAGPATVRVADRRASGTAGPVPYGCAATVLVARTAEGVCAVDLTGSGVDRRPVADLAGQGLTVVALDGAAVLATAPAPTAGLLATARVLLAAYAAGAAAGALDLAVAYARNRYQFGVPIGSFQAIQHRLADVATAVHSADLLVARAAWVLDTALTDGTAGAVLAAWHGATAAFVAASRAAVQTLGGYGFTLEYDAHLFYRQAKAVEVAFGPARGLTAAQARAVRDRVDDAFL
jgi:alkylation response protein AidB-like acyl-CoA dehydrogenase